MKLQGTTLRLSTGFQRSTDGQSEVTIKFVNENICHFISPNRDDWDSLLALGEFAYNPREHSSIGMSPFMADLGYQPRSVMDCVVASARPSQASKFVTHQQAMLAEAQDAMAAAQQRWHAACDQNRRHVCFNVGESVLLNTKGLDLAHLGTDGKQNFASRFIGPNKILQLRDQTRASSLYHLDYDFTLNITVLDFDLILTMMIRRGQPACSLS
ncbi:hypothetical protein PI125_g7523 [Phytophthora idaei]|nr:hypothetical protein PI125_g7523 [Phytophthora idaei]